MYVRGMDDCITLKASIKQSKQKRSEHFKEEKRYIKQKDNIIVEKKMKKEFKKKKRKHKKLCVFEKCFFLLFQKRIH